MEKEYIKRESREVTLNITGGKIDSFRKQNENNSTVRVYNGKYIGIAGAIGNADREELGKKAEDALSLKIPYCCALDGKVEKTEISEKKLIADSDMIPVMQDMLDKISRECPKFSLSNKITKQTFSSHYENTLGRNLFCEREVFTAEIIIQSKGSGNVFDGVYADGGTEFDCRKFVNGCKNMYGAFYNSVDLPNGTYPVIYTSGALLSFFANHFFGTEYASGQSLLRGKLEKKVFNGNFSFGDDRNIITNPYSAFFDAEGQFFENNRSLFVENGVLKRLHTTKNTAETLSLPISKTSVAGYDSTPSNGFAGIYVKPTVDSIEKFGKAILVVLGSGGDVTPEGHFATPVQLAFLVENGHLVGKLPELNISGDFFDIFGNGYIGTAESEIIGKNLYTATEMKVEKLYN